MLFKSMVIDLSTSRRIRSRFRMQIKTLSNSLLILGGNTGMSSSSKRRTKGSVLSTMRYMLLVAGGTGLLWELSSNILTSSRRYFQGIPLNLTITVRPRMSSRDECIWIPSEVVNLATCDLSEVQDRSSQYTMVEISGESRMRRNTQ